MKVTKKDICLCAMNLFKQHGFENIYVQDICNELGITRGSFYHHFRNKNDVLLFWELCDEKDKIDKLNELFDVDPKIHLKRFFTYYASDISKIGCDLLYFLLIATVESADNMANSHQGIGVYIGSDSIIDLIIEATKKPRYLAQNLIRHYNMAITGLILEWKLANGSFDFIAEADLIAETIFGLTNKE